MVRVYPKSDTEPANSFLRRFNRRVQQAGFLSRAKKNRFFEKPISRPERRQQAIVRNRRRRFYRF